MSKVKELWEKACLYDGIDIKASFVVFSNDNPFVKPYNEAIEKEFQVLKEGGKIKMSEHFIAMAGLHGYLPNYCASHKSYQDAVDDLSQLHELGKNRERELEKDGYLELNLHKDGNEYCEIADCDCDTPEIHND